MNDNEVPWYVTTVVSWIPFVMFYWIVWWHGRQIKKSLTAADGRPVAEVFADIARELKRSNDQKLN